MIKNKYLAIIPARKGSKRLPNKNILSFGGKPLIAWTIEAALESKFLSRVIVNTDSAEIAGVAEKFGAEVPFIRPDHLGRDSTTSFEVVKHTIDYLHGKGKEYEYLVLLQPTSPLRTAEDVDNAIELLNKEKAQSVTSVCEMDHTPLWSNTLPENNSMENFIKPEVVGKRSQDFKQYYRLNGAIYITKIFTLLEEKSFISSCDCFAYRMKKEHSADIDDENDFSLARFYLEKRKAK